MSNKEPKPILPEHLAELREILEGCRSGKLEHNQKEYFCGTAKCIAGYLIVRDMAKELKDDSWLTKKIILSESYSIQLFIKSKGFDEEWAYARRTRGLTDKEAYILFHQKATFEEQFDLLKKLEVGKRVL